eukprot:gene8806-9710_t
MVKKKVDPRVRGLIEHGVRKNHRSLFILVGDHGKDQVENIHRILSKTRVKSRPSVLWCYKKELGFSTHRQKRMKEIKKQQARGLYDADRDDPFDLFISSTNIRWTYYKETDKILGQTFGMCVLQDFEAITPNLLARTVETVEGGGIVVLLLKTVKSLKQLYTMTMDVHNRFRTEAHHEVVPRFNERFILSLTDCANCLVLDDELNVLPISSRVNFLPRHDTENVEEEDLTVSEPPELRELKLSLSQTPQVGQLVELTKTVDQARAVMTFLDAVSEKTLRSTVSLTAGRGRGKSAAIGLCLAGSVAQGYSNIFVTAPSPENLKTCFEFLIAGLKALKYVEHLDFEVLQEHVADVGKVVVRVNIFRQHRQTVQYIAPHDHVKLAQAELVAIDEAAAIPLPVVKRLLGPYLVFLSSTIQGYEGTGRSLSLKLLQQLRVQQGAAAAAQAQQAGAAVAGSKQRKGERRVHEERWAVAAQAAGSGAPGGRRLVEMELKVPIRYSLNDPVENWLNRLLCLESSNEMNRLVGVLPAPKDCDLYVVDRDALFSYHSLSESLLQRIWSLYTSAHYKNTPNDLQMLSDAPAHRLFVLLGPQRKAKAGELPDILCVVQLAFEGRISARTVAAELGKGNKAAGDLLPWTIAQQFNDSDFAALSGARIVRIATHPDAQSMGYGSRAMDLLISYFQGEMTAQTLSPGLGVYGGESGNKSSLSRDGENGDGDLLREDVQPRATLPPLLSPLDSRPAERLHYIGVSFGLTGSLLNFWTRKGFKVCYVRQTANDLTGEHSTIVLRELDVSSLQEEGTPRAGWLNAFVEDYRNRLLNLLSYALRDLPTALALTLVDPEKRLTAAAQESAVQEIEGEAVPSGLPKEKIEGALTASELLQVHMTYHDLKRLEMYARNMADHHMVLDLLPALARFLFSRRLGNVRVSPLQAAVLLAVGLQHRDVDGLCMELDLPANQVLAFFNKTVRKICTYLRSLVEQDAARDLAPSEAIARIEKRGAERTALKESLEEAQAQDAEAFALQRSLLMDHHDLSKHSVHADEQALQKALHTGLAKQAQTPKVISVPKAAIAEEDAAGGKKRKASAEEESAEEGGGKKRKEKKDKKQKKQH